MRGGVPATRAALPSPLLERHAAGLCSLRRLSIRGATFPKRARLEFVRGEKVHCARRPECRSTTARLRPHQLYVCVLPLSPPPLHASHPLTFTSFPSSLPSTSHPHLHSHPLPLAHIYIYAHAHLSSTIQHSQLHPPSITPPPSHFQSSCGPHAVRLIHDTDPASLNMVASALLNLLTVLLCERLAVLPPRVRQLMPARHSRTKMERMGPWLRSRNSGSATIHSEMQPRRSSRRHASHGESRAPLS